LARREAGGKIYASGVPHFSAPDIRASVWVIPTNGEMMIALHALTLVRSSLG
jgi:acetate kinase